MDNNNTRNKPGLKKSRLSWGKITIAVLILAAIAAGTIFFLRGWFNNSTDDAAIIERVGKLIVLPSNENPEVLTVTEADSLASAANFYSGVKNDDKILVYPKTAKIFVYRPSENMLINVGPILDDSAALEQPDAVKQP